MDSIIRPSADTRPRWRVALIGLSDQSVLAVRATAEAEGGQVVLAAPSQPHGPKRAALTRSDAVILSPARDPVWADDLLSLSLTRPVVLLAGEASRSLIKRAAKAGVAAFLAEPLHPAQLAPTLDLAIARFGDTAALRRKLADRKVIERAKGQVMAITGLAEEEAFRWLRTRAMETRAGLGDVARAVLAASVDKTPGPTRAHLLLAVDRRLHSVPAGPGAAKSPRRRTAGVR
jgi:AmiR/NasT family two-component response regulator